MTDSLDMGGIGEAGSPQDVVTRAVAAGVDAVMVTTGLERQLDAASWIGEHVRTARVREAIARAAPFRERFGRDVPEADIEDESARTLAAEIAGRSITHVGPPLPRLGAGVRVTAFARQGRMSALRRSRHVRCVEVRAPEADTRGALQDLASLEPAEGLPPYLVAKQLQNRAEWAGCAGAGRDALARKLPGRLFEQEALRMVGLASWHLGDIPTARDAFLRLGQNAPPGRSLESTRWLQLLGH